LGGAAIIAGHLKAMGAQPHLVTCVGRDDEATRTLLDTLDGMGIEHTALPLRDSLPVKVRYLADRQKLLKVNLGEAHPLDSAAQRRLLSAVTDLRGEATGMVMADFGYGSISVALLEKLLPAMRPHLAMIAGDVSGPRGTLRAMHGIDLITPTEREVRGICGDFERSLPAVTMELMRGLSVRNVITTLGAKGSVLFHVREVAPAEWYEKRLRTQWLPALGDRVEDVVGAGDALLATATLAMLRGASLLQAGYLGSAAAAVSVSRVGNLPVSAAEIGRLLRERISPGSPSLAAAG
jgi:bifunctional ADP-heptose synthase (sugar kinase/adenylyltransferase)